MTAAQPVSPLTRERVTRVALNWIRLDTAFADHPKVAALRVKRNGYRAIVVWLGALAYAGRHATDGYLPPTVLRSIDATNADMAALVDVRLLEVVTGGGWQVHDWADYQPSADVSTARREQGRRAARARWHPSDDRSSP